jgi:predicted CXXCH cytochrome family protein
LFFLTLKGGFILKKNSKQFVIIMIIILLIASVAYSTVTFATSNVTVNPGIQYSVSKITATGTYVDGDGVTLRLEDDNGNGVSSPKFTYSGGTWKFEDDSLLDGDYHYNLIRTALVDDDPEPLDFTIDTTPPSITASAQVENENVVINGTASDGERPGTKPEIKIYEEGKSQPVGTATVSDQPVNNNWNWSYSFPQGFADNIYTYQLEAIDARENTSPKTDITFTVDTTPPSLKITSSRFQNDIVVISGNADDNFSSGDQITISLFESSDSTSPITTTPDNLGKWSFNISIANGQYQYFVSATDSRENQSIKEMYNFNVGEVPRVTSIDVNYKYTDYSSELRPRLTDKINLLSNPDMNNVSTDTTFSVTISDDLITSEKLKNAIAIYDQNKNKVPGNFIDNGQIVPGDAPVLKNDSINKTVTFEYKPTALDPRSTYYVYINPLLMAKEELGTTGWSTDVDGNLIMPTDEDGNPLLPIMRKFTTETFEQIDKTSHPHGYFTNNTSACANCHSTHEGANSKLEKSGTTYFCMSCHDGTTGAPVLENNNDNKHFKENDPNEILNSSGDCSGCHDPHTGWKKENPNLIRESHYVYTHTDVTKQDNVNYPYGKELDLKDNSCKSCHLEETESKIEQAGKNTSKAMHYQKSSATGIPDNYSLCFRCHDGSKKWKDSKGVEHTISNIKQYYDVADENDTTKGNLSMHRITAIDGSSNLINSGSTSNDGHIPCAECHNTHSSNNIKNLKEKLGHENRQTFTAATGSWDATKEKGFCLKCHTGTTTINGVFAKKYDENDTDHKGTTQTCSYCHGGTDRSMLEAAHAPKSGTP